MVSPKRPASRRVESSSNQYMVLFVKILFVLVILFMLPSLVEGGSRRKRNKRNRRANTKAGIVYRRRLECEADCMEHIVYAEEAMNCIQKCVSPTCFQEIYEEPLEPGEIDLDKAGRLQSCAENEVVEMKRKERQKKKEEQEKLQ